jgi:hypothetical protein
MDVPGTAVGIASLGIQVCQGLLSYYDAWKGYDHDINSTYNAVTDLSRTLTILKTTLQQETDKERVERVRTCVNNCEDVLLELEKRRYSLRKYGQPEGLRQKMRAGMQRTWYPFRKETLEALKASVSDIQERLKLALQVLQLDIGTESQRLVLRLLCQTTMQSDFIAQITAQNQRILDAQQSDEFRKMVAWLAPPDPGTNHATARQRHESQTGDWLLKSSQYQSWKTGAFRHLWMYGKAGCCKTILCSTAIEDIRNTCEQDADTSSREWITVVGCLCADGTTLPPLLIYKSKTNTLQDSWLEDFDAKKYDCWFTSPSGWTNCSMRGPRTSRGGDGGSCL